MYLDTAGLTAFWREGLLAKKVLEGDTEGYKNHPQLERFKATANPIMTINQYLHCVVDEAVARGYNFNRTKLIDNSAPSTKLMVTEGQLAHEWQHLIAKLSLRSPALCEKWQSTLTPKPHPLFSVVPGPIASWERH